MEGVDFVVGVGVECLMWDDLGLDLDVVCFGSGVAFGVGFLGWGIDVLGGWSGFDLLLPMLPFYVL